MRTCKLCLDEPAVGQMRYCDKCRHMLSTYKSLALRSRAALTPAEKEYMDYVRMTIQANKDAGRFVPTGII